MRASSSAQATEKKFDSTYVQVTKAKVHVLLKTLFFKCWQWISSKYHLDEQTFVKHYDKRQHLTSKGLCCSSQYLTVFDMWIVIFKWKLACISNPCLALSNEMQWFNKFYTVHSFNKTKSSNLRIQRLLQNVNAIFVSLYSNFDI